MKTPATREKTPLIEVRHSKVHGFGVFALRRIRKGTTVVEYLGDRVTHDEADTRYEDKDARDSHTFLFTVDAKTVIDGGVNGNEARFVNHGCDPNCQSTTRKKRIFIEAVRTIQPGEELAYDYQIQRDDDDPADVDEIFACRCGAQSCRGSMLEARPKKRKVKTTAARKRKPAEKKKTKTAAKRSSAVTKSKAKTKGKTNTKSRRR
jgi:SET domain-containing protein